MGGCGCITQHHLPRVHKVEDTQFLRQSGSQAVCIQDYVVMQESGVCVQKVHLCCCSLCNAGVTVANYNRKHTVCFPVGCGGIINLIYERQ